MKRFLGILVVLGILASVVTASAAGVVAGVTPSTMLPRVGQPVTVTAWIDTGGMAVGSFSGALLFDPAALRYDSYTANLPGWMEVVNPTQAGAGRIYFSGANINGQVGRIVPIVITFTPLRVGGATLDLQYPAMAQARTYAKITPTVRDGQLWVRR